MIAQFCTAAVITLSLYSVSAAQPRAITPASQEFECLASEISVLGPNDPKLLPAEYPKETAELLGRQARWRRQLRAPLPVCKRSNTVQAVQMHP